MTTNEKKAQVVKDAVERFNDLGINFYSENTKDYFLKKNSKLIKEYGKFLTQASLKKYLFTFFYGQPWKQHHTYINDVEKQIRMLSSS
jgi:hypothetical protein